MTRWERALTMLATAHRIGAAMPARLEPTGGASRDRHLVGKARIRARRTRGSV